MISSRENAALLVARVCLASLFLWSGLEKALDIHGASQFAASHGVPLALQLMPLAVAVEIGCAVMLVTGWRVRWAALILAAWMLVLGPWFHPFWNAPPEKWQVMIDDFFHHVVMIGGMIYVVVFGPGDIALSHDKSIAR